MYYKSFLLYCSNRKFDFEPQRKEEDMLAQKKMPDGQKEEISQVRISVNSKLDNFNEEHIYYIDHF